jgi:hypothetical protein
LLVGAGPALEELVEGGVFLAHGLAGVVLERLGDQLAVRAVVLDALGDDVDGDLAADDVLDALFAQARHREGSTVGRDPRPRRVECHRGS